MVGLLFVVNANSELASNLESRTFELVNGKQQEIVLPQLRKAMAALPGDLSQLTMEQSNSIKEPSEAYARLAQWADKVQMIRDQTSDAMIVGPLCAFTTFVSGVLIQLGHYLAPWATVTSVGLGFLYFNWGILQRRRVRRLEKLNRRMLTSSSVGELRAVADEALTKYLS